MFHVVLKWVMIRMVMVIENVDDTNGNISDGTKLVIFFHLFLIY